MVDLFPEELTPLIYTKTHYSEKQANILYLVFFFSVIEKKMKVKDGIGIGLGIRF